MNSHDEKMTGAVLVQGGGIAGVQASLDLANSGFKVYLVEKSPIIGGMMAHLDKTFPTGDCATCIISPKLVECARNRNIEILTLSELDTLKGDPGRFKATVKRHPRFIDETKCSGCGECTQFCPVKYEIYHDSDTKPQVVIGKENLATVQTILARHENKRGALMPILKDINAAFRYLPEDVLRYISVELNIPLSLIFRIATFYSSFSLIPRGRHTISVCTGTTCYVRGASKIMDILQAELHIAQGQTTSDKRFSLESVRCLGCCSLAPVISIDGNIYGHLNGKDVMEVLQEYE